MVWERSRIVMADEGGDDFTFAAAQPPPSLLSAGGGGGFIGPPLLYPVFGRPRSPPRDSPAPAEQETATAPVPLGRLLLLDKDPASPPAAAPTDDVDDLDSVPPEMYCLWSPGWSSEATVAEASSRARCKKSGSTGSVLRWRPRLDVGRSQSDGKKFVFLSTAAASSGGSSGRRNQLKGRGGAVEGAAGGGAGAHAWSCYVDNNKSRGARRRRTFLPYKQDLVGLFANTAVFRRSYLPF